MLKFDFDFEKLEIEPQPNTSDDSVISEAFKENYAKLVKQDKFSALTLALATCKFLHAKENEILDINLNQQDQFNHTLIIAEPNSQLNIIEKIKANSSNYRGNIVEIHAAENTEINFISYQRLSKETYCVTSKVAELQKNAKVNWLDITLGAKFAKSDVVSLLKGKGAATNSYGIFLGSKEQQFDLYAEAIHAAEETKSDILMKGALKDKAKALYRGLIKIEPVAAKSDGYQKEEVLLLSEDAEADAIPNLEIKNEDVRCTHGASIGKIDDEKLFYLMSRGLSRREAEKLIVEGFFDSLLQKVNIQNEIKSILLKKLK